MGFTLKISVGGLKISVGGLLCLFVLFAVVEGSGGGECGECGGCAPSPIVEHSDTQTHEAKKSPLFAFIVARWYIIPLHLIKPFICPQIEPREKNRKTTSEERKKNPARRRGKFCFIGLLFISKSSGPHIYTGGGLFER